MSYNRDGHVYEGFNELEKRSLPPIKIIDHSSSVEFPCQRLTFITVNVDYEHSCQSCGDDLRTQW